MLLERCPWYVAGPSLGLLLVLFRVAVNKPFGVMGGFVDLVQNKSAWHRWGVGAFVLLGIVLGGAVFALASGNFGPTLNYASGAMWLPDEPAIAFVVLLAAATVMGFGARLAGGCTSGHGLSGMSLGSPASTYGCYVWRDCDRWSRASLSTGHRCPSSLVTSQGVRCLGPAGASRAPVRDPWPR
jgi:uncharacterized membrane protein YedE/YeeE